MKRLLWALVLVACLLAAGSYFSLSNSVRAEALRCEVCWDVVSVSDYDARYGTYGYVWAYASGTVCVPSDGNLYDAYGDGGGWASVDYILVEGVNFEERGCNGDTLKAWANLLADPDGDGYAEEWLYAEAFIGAPPCCAI